MFAVDAQSPGVFAEYVCVDERRVGPKPLSLSWSQAATIPLSNLTAWEALTNRLNIPTEREYNNDKAILIVGGAGGVATAAMDWAQHVLGLTVIATASQEQSMEFVQKLGVQIILNHYQPLLSQLKRHGIDYVDYVLHCADLNDATVQELVNLVKPMGGICCMWPLENASVNLHALFQNSIQISIVPILNQCEDKRYHDILSRVANHVDHGVLSCHEITCLPLTCENLRKALTLQMSGRCIGKTSLYFAEPADEETPTTTTTC